MIEELREKLFFDIAVKKEFKERIQFEFSNYKKRMYGLNRFSHGCDVVLNTNILISFSQFIEILTGDGDKEYYVISFDYLDGIIMDKQQCLNYLSISSTAIVVGKKHIFIKEEPERKFIIHYFKLIK